MKDVSVRLTRKQIRAIQTAIDSFTDAVEHQGSLSAEVMTEDAAICEAVSLKLSKLEKKMDAHAAIEKRLKSARARI